MSVVSLRNVVVVLGGFPALAGAALEVGSGEAVLLQGPNGAGKTTLLRLCAGLVRPQSGEATVLGHDLFEDRRALRPRVGIVGHESMLYEDLTVWENLDFWGSASGVDATQVKAAASHMNIESRLFDVPVRILSAGQRRRTSLAVAAARRPELWLLDEPHAGLDQAGRDIVDGLIADAVAAGATVIVASHELDRVRPVVNRQVTVAGGFVTSPALSSEEVAGAV
ncbi:MAG: heme ABC exporter ATP-binding protein CcmA [Acidimicrobiales bacterium]